MRALFTPEVEDMLIKTAKNTRRVIWIMSTSNNYVDGGKYTKLKIKDILAAIKVANIFKF